MSEHKYKVGQFVVVKNENGTNDCQIIELVYETMYRVHHAGSNMNYMAYECDIVEILDGPTGSDPYRGLMQDGDKFDFSTGKIFNKHTGEEIAKEKCKEVSTFATGAVRDTAKGKAPLSQLDNELLVQTALVLEYGEKKYSRGNWRKGIPYNRCIDSLMRHIAAFKEGETHDKETGLHHLGHASCNLMFLLRYEADDRTDLDDRDKV